jgi:hypothetical protein
MAGWLFSVLSAPNSAVFAVFAGNYQRAGTSPPQESWVSDDPAAKEQRDNSEKTAAWVSPTARRASQAAVAIDDDMSPK